MSEKRVEPRIPVEAQLRYSPRDGVAVHQSVTDLSEGGMFVATTDLFPKGHVFPGVLLISDTKEEIRVIGRVAHLLSHAEASRFGRAPGMGIELMGLPPQDQARIVAYLKRLAQAEMEQPREEDKLAGADLLLCLADATHIEEAVQGLRKNGFGVQSAEHGLAALMQCLKQPPSMLLCSLHLRPMDGWTLLQMVRSRASLRTVPFVFLGAPENEADRLHGFRLGADDYIPRGLDIDDLVRRIRRTLLRSQRRRAVGLPLKALAGDLEQVSLRHLLLHLENARETGSLLLVREHEQAAIFVKQGRVVQCRSDRMMDPPDARLRTVLGWTTGRFEFCPHEVPSHELDLPIAHLFDKSS